MAKSKRARRGIGDPLSEGEDRSQVSNQPTSRNREESMTESGEDAFGSDSAVRNPDRSQRSRTSGTTGLGGEDPDSKSAMKEEE
jgi:hypothetical protein